ncbi:MAG: aromatic ring-hydroxylating dioxygenase subunit alpha [Candidatus Binatia bacterium]
MDVATQTRLADRIRALRAAGTTDLAARTYRVAADDYTSPTVLAAELDVVFARRPLLAGLSGDARRPGDWFTFEACGRSALVWRAPDGVLRAFVNACRHRGMRVAEGAGHAERMIVCPYHSWSYTPDGRLNAIPGDEGFSDLAREEIALTPLRVHEQAGLVFVGGDAADPSDPCEGAAAELAPFGLGAYQQVERRTHRLPLNWKLAVDSFMEAYHLHFLHKDTLRPIFHGNVSAFDAFGRHSRIVGVRRTFDTLAADSSELLPHVTLLYQLFPNAVLIYQQDHVELYQAFPDLTDPHTAEVRLTLYAPAAPTTDAERAYWKKNIDLIDGVTTSEDFAACAAIHANLRARAIPFLILGRNEPGVAHFHRMLHGVLGHAGG